MHINDDTKPASNQDEDHGKDFMGYITSIPRETWKQFINTPPQYRAVIVLLFISILVIVSPIIVAVTNLIQAELNLVYVILAIPTSFIVIMNWLRKQRKK